jgi:hypothetical protein
VHGPRLPPGGERGGYRLVKPGLADRFDAQDGAGLRDDLTAVAPHAYARVEPDRLLHLESASGFSVNKDLDNPHSWWSEALFAGLTTCRKARFMKARG